MGHPERQERRQHEISRNFVHIPHQAPSPRRNRSSIQLPAFHGVSFRIIDKQRRSVYHQLDGSIELASTCNCEVHFSEGMWGWPDFKPMWVECSEDCPIDEHRIAAQRAMRGEAA